MRCALILDPSSSATGWAVLLPYQRDRYRNPLRIKSGCFVPSKAQSAADPFDQLAMFIRYLIEGNGAHDVVIEIPSKQGGGPGQNRSFATLRTYVRAVGNAEGVGRAMGCRVHTVEVCDYKGRGSSAAKKGTSIAYANKSFGVEVTNHNEADALHMGLVWCCSLSMPPRSPAVIGGVP